ncbi:MAG: Hpt domain-containing protein, partial [Gemmatimonadota bacterium]|nr:Hpt domain-containing protein [Gemmatimonadota bacterium]
MLTIEREGALPDEERATLLRLLHTLKGNAGMIGLAAIQEYVHALEECFRTPPSAWSSTLLDRLFAGAGALRRAVEDATTAGEADAFARLTELHPAAEPGSAMGGPAPPAVPEAPPPPDPPPAAARGDEMVRVPWAKLD